MNKAIIGSLTAVVLAVAVPSFAQGPFADVPVDHWAYEAVSTLQEKGIVIGYPDGTFSGKRAMTRYEFALALSRAIPVIVDMSKTGPNGESVSDSHINDLIDAKMKGLSIPDITALNKSIDEFKSELSQMGVDLDALKRDVASLEERVAALEAEHKRLKITSKFSFFALGEDTDRGTFVDKDNRPAVADNNLLENVSVVRDADVILSYEASGAKAKVVLNAGNYLSYLGSVTNFTGSPRTTGGADYSDSVNLFLAYGEVPVLGADVTVGRFPIQFTKWTLKKFDVDTYTENWKTDDGNYYVDGGKAAWNWGNVDLLAYAGKNNTNSNMYNFVSTPLWGPSFSPNIGAISSPVQSAGIRAAFGLGTAKVGLNYINAGSAATDPWDRAQVWGADVDFDLGSWKWNAAYTESDSNDRASIPGGSDVTNNNAAWEVAAAGAFGGLGINAAYVRIENNFAAPGDWRRIGRWQNPTNIQGPEVGLKYGLNDRWSLSASGAWYNGVKTLGMLNADDKLQQYKAGVNLALGEKGGLGFDAEWVRWDVTGVANNPQERYYTISYNHMLTDNAKLRLMYQINDFDDDASPAGSPYGNSYKGNIAVVQASMDF